MVVGAVKEKGGVVRKENIALEKRLYEVGEMG